MFCIYHDGCIDGLMAAAVVLYCNTDKDVNFYAARYGQQPPWELVEKQDVVIVDFSYPRDLLVKVAQQAKSLLVLDHHKSAQEDLSDLILPHTSIKFDMNKSGAGLAWDHYLPESKRPMLVDMVEDRDLWRFKIPSSAQIHKPLTCIALQTPARFEELLVKSMKDSTVLKWLINDGEVMDTQFNSQLAELKKHVFVRKIAGYTVPVANASYMFASELGGALAEGNPFAATYFFDGVHYSFSLRSRGEEGVDVSAVAKQYGGGGHRNAAGFKLTPSQMAYIL